MKQKKRTVQSQQFIPQEVFIVANRKKKHDVMV